MVFLQLYFLARLTQRKTEIRAVVPTHPFESNQSILEFSLSYIFRKWYIEAPR